VPETTLSKSAKKISVVYVSGFSFPTQNDGYLEAFCLLHPKESHGTGWKKLHIYETSIRHFYANFGLFCRADEPSTFLCNSSRKGPSIKVKKRIALLTFTGKFKPLNYCQVNYDHLFCDNAKQNAVIALIFLSVISVGPFFGVDIGCRSFWTPSKKRTKRRNPLPCFQIATSFAPFARNPEVAFFPPAISFFNNSQNSTIHEAKRRNVGFFNNLRPFHAQKILLTFFI